jgi:uncharacterized protein YpuA (DUF1002 family)
MIWTRQIAIENWKSFVSKSTFQSIETILKTMNQISNIFESQMMKTIEIAQQNLDYAILQTKLDQFEQKWKRVELLKKMKKAKTIKIVEFFEIQLFSLINRIIIDEFQKENSSR